jgi:hypothetical protein
MSASRSVLWDLRDNRTLSAYAKLAYVMLWSREPDIRPSMQTLAGDMGTSKATAKRAVRELEDAGLLKRIGRLTVKGDADTNQFELVPLRDGWVQTDPTQGQTDPTGGITRTPEVSNTKTVSEGPENRQGSRRAQPAVSRDGKIAHMRRAVLIYYSADEAKDLTDGECAGLWDHLVEDRTPRDPVAYLGKIFTETPYLDTHLAMVEAA